MKLFIFVETMVGRAERIQRVMQAQQGLADGAGGPDHRMKNGDGDSFDDSLSRSFIEDF